VHRDFFITLYFLAGAGDFLFSKTVKTGCGALPACRSVGTFVKRPGHHVCHSPPSSAEVKNEWRRTSAPTICLYGVDRNNFALYCLPIFLVFSSLWPCDSIALFLEVGLLTVEQGKVQSEERGPCHIYISLPKYRSFPNFHSDAFHTLIQDDKNVYT
jgi:hypothetical protein